MSTWTKLKRKGGAKPDRTPLVSIRRQAIALNAQFVAQASLDDFTRVSVFVDADRFRIGLQFHNETRDEDSFALTTDGGGRGKGRSFQVTGLMKEYPWIEAVSRVEDKRLRRFGPEWISADSKWVISLCPAFEHRVSDKSNIPSDVRGIYRYRRED